MTELSSLLTPSKEIEIDYPGLEGFKIKLAFLSRDAILKIRKKCTVTKFDKRSRQPIDELDEDLFQKTFVSSVVKGWTGLKFKYLEELALVDLSKIEDVEAELEYSEANAVQLLTASQELDQFVSEVTSSLSNFTKYSSTN